MLQGILYFKIIFNFIFNGTDHLPTPQRERYEKCYIHLLFNYLTSHNSFIYSLTLGSTLITMEINQSLRKTIYSFLKDRLRDWVYRLLFVWFNYTVFFCPYMTKNVAYKRPILVVDGTSVFSHKLMCMSC